MSAFTQALTATREKAAVTPQGNVVMEITAIGDKSFTGTVTSGAAKGTVVEVQVPKTGVTMDEYKDPENLAHVNVGDLLRVEGISVKNDVTTCRWMKPWLQMHNDGKRDVVYDLQTSFIDLDAVSTRNGGVRDRTGAKLIAVNSLDMDGEVFAKDMDALEKAMIDGFNSKGTVNIFASDPETGNLVLMNYRLKASVVDGKRTTEDVNAKVSGIIEKYKSIPGFEDVLAEAGMSVVPTSSHFVGSKTSKAIEKDMIARTKGRKVVTGTVNPDDFKPMTIGQRLGSAFMAKGDNAIPAEYEKEIREKFLKSASEDAKAAFHEDGWRNVSDTDLKDFFKEQGVDLRDHPTTGWSGCAVMMQDYKGDGGQFVAKTFKTGACSPYPPVKACDDLRAEFYSEMREAVVSVCQAPEKAAEADKAADESAKNAPEKGAEVEAAAEADDASIAEIDDILDGMDMDLEDMSDAPMEV